jgi:hypothetical protein
VVQGGGLQAGPREGTDPRVEWAMTCDYVILDTSSRFSLIGVFEGINLTEAPGVHTQFFVVSMWNGQPLAPFTAETWIWSPDNEVLTRTQPFASQFSPHGKGLIINRFLNVSFPRPGVYTIELLADGRGIHQFPLIIQAAPVQQPQQPMP